MKTPIEKQKFKIDELIDAALSSDDFDALCVVFAKNSKMPFFRYAVKTLLSKLEDDVIRLWKLTNQLLIYKEWPARAAAGYLLPFFYEEREYDIKPLLLRIADDRDSNMRSHAATIFGILLDNYYYEIFPVFTRWIYHPSENVRLTIALSTTKAIKDTEPVKVRQLLRLIKPLLFDNSSSVKKHLGPSILGKFFLQQHPHIMFEYLWRWTNIEDENARSTLAISMSSAGAVTYPELALEYLEELGRDQNKLVWDAVATSLFHLAKKRPDVTNSILDKWMKDALLRRPAEAAKKLLGAG